MQSTIQRLQTSLQTEALAKLSKGASLRANIYGRPNGGDDNMIIPRPNPAWVAALRNQKIVIIETYSDGGGDIYLRFPIGFQGEAAYSGEGMPESGPVPDDGSLIGPTLVQANGKMTASVASPNDVYGYTSFEIIGAV